MSYRRRAFIPTTTTKGRCGSHGSSTERGAAIIELALVMPLLIMMLFGIVEFGIAFSRAQAVEAAAREGARLASLSSSALSDIETRVDETLAGMPLDNPPSVTVTPSGCEGKQGDPITVEVSAQHTIAIPMVLETDITLTGEAVFRCEA